MVLTHGESDSDAKNPNYGAQLVAMQTAYQADLSAITGQGNQTIWLILSQRDHSDTPLVNLVLQAQWRVAIDHSNAIL